MSSNIKEILTPHPTPLAEHYKKAYTHIQYRAEDYRAMCQSAIMYGRTLKGVHSALPPADHDDVQALIHQTLFIENPHGDFSYCLRAEPLITPNGLTFGDNVNVVVDIGYIRGTLTLEYGILHPPTKYIAPKVYNPQAKPPVFDAPTIFKYSGLSEPRWTETQLHLTHNGYIETPAVQLDENACGELSSYFLQLAVAGGLPGFRGNDSTPLFDPEHFNRYSPYELFAQYSPKQ